MKYEFLVSLNFISIKLKIILQSSTSLSLCQIIGSFWKALKLPKTSQCWHSPERYRTLLAQSCSFSSLKFSCFEGAGHQCGWWWNAAISGGEDRALSKSFPHSEAPFPLSAVSRGSKTVRAHKHDTVTENIKEHYVFHTWRVTSCLTPSIKNSDKKQFKKNQSKVSKREADVTRFCYTLLSFLALQSGL